MFRGAAEKSGWGGRIRTSECRFQRPVSYHLTTPQQGGSVQSERRCVFLPGHEPGRDQPAGYLPRPQGFCRGPAQDVAIKEPEQGASAPAQHRMTGSGFQEKVFNLAQQGEFRKDRQFKVVRAMAEGHFPLGEDAMQAANSSGFGHFCQYQIQALVGPGGADRNRRADHQNRSRRGRRGGAPARRRGRRPGRCRRAGRRARRRPGTPRSPPVRRRAESSPHSRFRPRSVVAASELPPPRPAWTGIRLASSMCAPEPPAASRSRRAARRHRLRSSAGTPGSSQARLSSPSGRGVSVRVSARSMVWKMVRSSWYPSGRRKSTRRCRLILARAGSVSGVVIVPALPDDLELVDVIPGLRVGDLHHQ